MLLIERNTIDRYLKLYLKIYICIPKNENQNNVNLIYTTVFKFYTLLLTIVYETSQFVNQNRVKLEKNFKNE